MSNIKKLHEAYKNKEIKPSEYIKKLMDEIKASKLNAFITINEEALEEAKKLDELEADNIFFGVPIAIKDNILTKGIKTTCASKMLEDFMPVYDATVINKIKDKKMIIIGKTNMDEFAFGSRSDTSAFGKVLNPCDLERVPGGSSGGSAAATKAFNLLSLGSDTGGSIRQPASFCGVVGMKPTYGLISRYGLTSFASSLDQIGPLTNTVLDNALLLDLIKGKDDNDLTSSSKDIDVLSDIDKDIKGLKIALPKFYYDGLNEDLKAKFEDLINFLEKEGVSFNYVDTPYFDKSYTLYQILAMGEASSNLARFDSIRYGSYAQSDNLDDLYEINRGKFFGEEVKRRIMVGSYLLSGDNAKIYYDKALSIRSAICHTFDNIYKDYDLILAPITSGVAPKFDEKYNYAFDDLMAIPSNLAGTPSLSLNTFTLNGLPLNIQIEGPKFSEALIYRLAYFIEQNYKEKKDV